MNWRLPLPSQAFSRLLLQALTALLGREPWARDRLVAHAGKSVRLTLGGSWQLQASVSSTGLLQACDAAVAPDVTLCLPAGRLHELPALWQQQGASGVVGLMHIEGDAGLTRVIADLARGMRWDIEEDLSHLVGDVLAVRLVAAARQGAGATRAAAGRARDNLGEYLTHESQLGVGSAEWGDHAATLAQLSQRLDHLESRLGRLEQAC